MRRDLALLCALLVVRVVLDAVWLASDPLAFVELEEGWNATAAWMLVHGDLGESLLTLRYKEFCGGCTVVSLVGAGPLAVFGDTLWAWKLQGFGWTAGTTVFGWLALRRLFGSWAAGTWAALNALPPAALSAQGLVLFGNHHEVQLFVMLALWGYAARRSAVVGGALGFGLAFCRTAAFGLPLLVAAAWMHRKSPRELGLLAVSWAIGVSWILLPSAAGDTIGYDLAALASDPFGRVMQLIDPAVVGERVFLSNAWAAAPLLLAGVVGAFLMRRSIVVALPLAFAGGFVLSGVALPEDPGVVVLMNGRYWGPWALMLALLVAASAETHKGLLALPLLVAALLTRPFPSTSEPMPRATEMVFFTAEASHRLVLEDLEGAQGSTAREETVLRILEGIELGRLGRDAEGDGRRFGLGLHRAREPFAEREEPLDAWLGRGMSANLMAHLGPDAPDSGWLASGGGAELVQRCGMQRSCLSRALERSERPDELAFGYGLALGEVRPVERAALVEVLGDGAFLDGLDHPLAGLDRPVGSDAPLDVPVRAPSRR